MTFDGRFAPLRFPISRVPDPLAVGVPQRNRIEVMRWHGLPTVVLTLGCDSCDYVEYSTQAGEYVAYHWDANAWAAENERLCGGTVKAADRFVAAIAAHYDWPLPQDGPRIEYFWQRNLNGSVCAWSGGSGCTFSFLGVQVFTSDAFDSHELAHTAGGGHGHAAFIDEGFAVRWESGVVAMEYIVPTSPTFLTEDQLRAQLEVTSIEQLDIYRGAAWQIALEATYGPAKMAEFFDELGSSSVSDVEHTLQRVFGISLAESVALAESLPEASFIDDPVCEFVGLPTFVWNPNEPLVIDRNDAHCGDDDLVSIVGGRAAWLIAFEFPEPALEVVVRVTASQGDTIQKSLAITDCDGKLGTNSQAYDMLGADGPNEPGTEQFLGGRYVGSLVGPIAADGSVGFPTVVIEKMQP